SIARFRCVNKGWCNLLKNPEFLMRQYKHAVEQNRFSIMFHRQNDIYTFSYDPSSSTCESSGHVEFPVRSFKGIEFFGCCHGLVLLKRVNVLMLWNPLTNECKKLPNPSTRFKDYLMGFEEYGISYDHQIEDFKVVCLTQDFLDNRCEVQVYTLRSNSWRRLEDIQFRMYNYMRVTDMARLSVNGCLYWKASRWNLRTEIILRFDFEKEEFDQIPIPDVVNHDNQACVCVLGGSLWFLNEYGCSLEFWELKDNGVEKSWIRRITFNKDKFDDMEELTPLWLLENGKILFGVHDDPASLRFVLYDPEHETTRTLKTCEGISAPSLHTSSVYVESLISLDSGTYLGQVQWDWYAPRASAMG
ncbi:hypothetical protein MKW92_037123, partial [Papaver armeniacum]